jgi:hypothetical protein
MIQVTFCCGFGLTLFFKRMQKFCIIEILQSSKIQLYNTYTLAASKESHAWPPGAFLCLKILAFRSFQTFQEARRTTDASAFWFGVEAPVMRLHQS